MTLVFRLVLEAQRANEPVAWITTGHNSTFFPGDAAELGIDLSALIVVNADGLLPAARAADHLLRSGAFGLIALDCGRAANLPLPAQTRLAGLANKHATALLCLTEKEAHRPSLGSLVSLRVQTSRISCDGEFFMCAAQAVKDKRRRAGWSHAEACLGPDGLR